MKKTTAPFAIPLLFLILIIAPQLRAQINLDVGGYMQTWYIADEQHEQLDTNGDIYDTTVQGFRIRRARTVARGQINDHFSAATWIEFAGSSPSLLCFYGDAHIAPWLNIRLGQFIMPGQSFETGRLASSQLIFYDRAAITSALSRQMGFDFFRDIGVMAYGRYGSLWYGIHASNGTGRFQQAGSNITERKSGGGIYGGRVDIQVFDGFTLGGHLSTNQQRDVVQNGTGPFDINRTSYSVRAVTNNLGINGLFSQFEYMHLTSKDSNGNTTLDSNGEYNLNGFYAELGYRITPVWHITGRYDEMTQTPGQAFDTGRFHSNRYVLGLSRYIRHDGNEIVRAHLNYSFGQSGPMELSDSIILLVFQLRFLP
jgi:hypothetical protein